MSPDATLLREFLRDDSEPAFAELVRRHVDLVYSAALRQLSNNSHLAEDVTQAVFAELLRQAPHLVQHPTLAGWLYTTASHLAARARRSEQRRTRRETTSLDMLDLLRPDAADAHWTELRPVLDDSLLSLSRSDREMVVLRFFQNRPFAEIGQGFGLSENAARMRVERALDRLRHQLARRGITSTAALLSGALGSHAVGPAPASLLASLTPGTLAAASASLAHLLPSSMAAGRWMQILDTLVVAKNWVLTGAITALAFALVPTFASRETSLPPAIHVEFGPPPNSPAEAAPSVLPPGSDWSWASVDSADYRQLVANLRASGAPERLIRDFIALDLQRTFAVRYANASPRPATREYWKKEAGPVQSEEQTRKAFDIAREQYAILRGLFGPTARPNDAINLLFGGVDFDAIPLAWLPAEVGDRVLATLQSLLDEQHRLNALGQGYQQTEERYHFERCVAALKDVLTPDQLEEYRWRQDPDARQIRIYTRNCDLDREDFLRLAQRTGSDLYRPTVSHADQQDLERRAAQFVRPEKVRDFVRGVDLTYQNALNVTDHLGLPRDVAHRIWEIKSDALAAAAGLDGDPPANSHSLTPQRRALAERAEREMKSLIGDEGFRAVYNADWPWWKNLLNPGAVPAGPRSR